MSLDEALTRIAAGDDGAFREVYERTRKTVYYIALSVVRERMLAEDVMQTTYLKVLGNASRYRKGTNAAAWIARIARNEAIGMLRKRSREVAVDEREQPHMFGTGTVDDYGLLIDLARRILKEEEFSVLMLSASEGYKRREIAEMLSMPLPTVSWHYSRAVQKMRRALEEEKRETPSGGIAVNKRELERELRREAEEHTPDVYARVISSQPVREAQGEVVAAVRPKAKWAWLAVGLAVLLVIFLCAFPFLSRGGAGLSGTLYISINPAVEFSVEEDRVTGVRALNRDAALLLQGETLLGLSPEDASERFVRLSGSKHLITEAGVGVSATGEDGAKLEARVRDRLSGLSGGTSGEYAVHAMEESELEALIAAYDERAMGDFEDYLERELAHLRDGFEERVYALMETYLDDLSEVDVSDAASIAAFNAKYLYLGEDCIFEDEDVTVEELREEFAKLQYEIARHGKEYIFDELYDEFLEAVEELYEQEDQDDNDEDDD